MQKRSERRRSDRQYRLLPTSIRIGDRSYPVHDIGPEGIGLRIEAPAPLFTIGQRIESIPIPAAGETRSIAGVVSHISRTGAGQVWGIRFIFKDSEEYEAVQCFRRERTPDTADE